jgi:hypothetical protein
MINDINANSEYLTVAGTTSPTYVTGFSGMQGVGNVRYNTSSQCMEVYDGNNWIRLNTGSTYLDVSSKTRNILQWAEKKMQEEQRVEELCKQYPGLSKARDNYELFKKFVNEQEKVDYDSNSGFQVSASP